MPPVLPRVLGPAVAISLALSPASSWAMPGATPGGAPPPAGAPEGKAPPTVVTLQVPAFDDDFQAFPVARVGGEVITLMELMQAVATSHEGRMETAAGKSDFAAVLDRIIDLRLFVLEARESGFDDNKDFLDAVASFRVSAARSALEAEITKDVEPDPAEVEELFRDAVREWKIRSALFATREAADELLAAVKGGEKFDDALKKAIAEKKAEGSGEASDFIPVSGLQGGVKEAVVALKQGEVSPPIRVKEGFAVLRIEESRHPENALARAEAEAASRNRRSVETLRAFHESLTKKYVKRYDRKLLATIDYHAKKPGFAAYLKDQRVLVRVDGAPPITVATLTKHIQAKFFHGIDGPIEEKKLNERKQPSLDFLVYRAVFDREARARKIEETLAFKRRVEDFEHGQLFGVYLEKAIAPSVKVSEDDLRAYYEANKKEFTVPALYTLDGIGFAKAQQAQSAMNRLNAGTEFKWLKQNAEGQVPDAQRDSDLEGRTLIQSSMPPELVKSLSGAEAGDYRMYVSPLGGTYVLLVTNLVPEQTRSFEQSREAIAKKVFGQAMQKALTSWAARLREAYGVEVFITRLGR